MLNGLRLFTLSIFPTMIKEFSELTRPAAILLCRLEYGGGRPGNESSGFKLAIPWRALRLNRRQNPIF